MKTLTIAALGFCSLLFSLCSNPEIRKFNATSEEGVIYEYEVIVPLMNYVRVRPLTTADQLTGEVTIPSTIKYDGTRYVVTQIAAEAFEDYAGITRVTLPATISTIEEEAFRNCTALSQINTPQPLSTIEEQAFENCVSLTDFSFDASISTLGEECFAGCTSLTDITLPTSLNTISQRAFFGCTSVTNISLSSTINSIGAEAFAGCLNVEQMTCMAGMPPAASANSFNGIDSEIPVTVPMGGIDYYRTATGWNHFTNYNGVY